MKTDRSVLKTLRNAIELYYDHQQARISYDHRANDPNRTANLSADDKEFMETLASESSRFEKSVLKYAAKKMDGHEIYEWLIEQRGIAATFAVIFMGYIDIEKTPTASALWSLCGLSVVNGKAVRRVKGEKIRYNPHLKSRCYLLGESFLKARNEHWRPYYDDYKARKQREICKCMLCGGTGLFASEDDPPTVSGVTEVPPEGVLEVAIDRELEADVDAEIAAERAAVGKGKKVKKPKKCGRCDGTGTAPWGRSDKHVHMAAMRYMVKMFLIELYRRWRTYEGLEVRVPYSEEYHERMKMDRPAHGR
jgi:hypothetical protein